MDRLSKIKKLMEQLSPDDQRDLERWLSTKLAEKASPKASKTPPVAINPASVNRRYLPGFSFQRTPYGWKAKFSGNPKLFGRPVLLIVETSETPDFSKLPPPISQRQAALVQKVRQGLTTILKKVKGEVSVEPDEDGDQPPLNIYVWLHHKNDDGKSWEFVVERADGSGFAHHLAYRGTKFVEVWAGD